MACFFNCDIIEYDEIIQTLSERVKFLVLETRD